MYLFSLRFFLRTPAHAPNEKMLINEHVKTEVAGLLSAT